MNAYWKKRYQKENDYLLNRTIDEETARLQKIYLKMADETIDSITAAYAKFMEKPTDNHKFVLKRETAFLKQLTEKLEQLGVKLDKRFSDALQTAYKASDKVTNEYICKIEEVPVSTDMYEKVDKRAEYATKNVWADDGKNWSERIWKDIGALQQKLEYDLTKAIELGEGPMKLTAKLMGDFSVSYSAAKRLAVTEMNYVYSTAAKDRMKESGIEQYEWFTAKDERVCKKCNELNGKRFPITDQEHIPPRCTHPLCRCCILAVI